MLANSFFIWWAAQVAALVILVVLFLRWRPGFMGGRTIGETLGRMLDARQDQIQAQLEAAQKSREEAARIRQESEVDIANARDEAREIVNRATGTSEAIRQDVEQRAREEYERIVAQARVEINFERERAEMALQRRAADIVVDSAGRVIERYLTPQSDQRLVDQSLSDLKELR